MDTLPFIVSLGGNILAGIVLPWMALKLFVAGRDQTALEEANKGLRKAIAEMKPDAERGKRSRLQAAAALASAQRVNRERNAAKVAGK